MNLGYHMTLKTVSLLFGNLCQPMEEVWEVQLTQRVMWREEHDLLRISSQSFWEQQNSPQGPAAPRVVAGGYYLAALGGA